MKRTTKFDWNDPSFFPSQLSFNCVPIELKMYCIPIVKFTYDTKHDQQYTITWQHEKGTFSIRIGHKILYVWTHDTYTKVLGCKTGNKWPSMYTWIIKIAIDVAQTSHLTSLQVLWPIYSFHKGLSIFGNYLIRNNIFLDKAYALSTYLFKSYWSNNIKSWWTPRSIAT